MSQSILAQILEQMYVEPELLAELDDEQKQILFCKMREEQLRRWQENDRRLGLADNRGLSRAEPKVRFLLDRNGEPWVWVMGEHAGDKTIDQIIADEQERRAHDLAENELRRKEEEELKAILRADLPLTNISNFVPSAIDSLNITKSGNPELNHLLKRPLVPCPSPVPRGRFPAVTDNRLALNSDRSISTTSVANNNAVPISSIGGSAALNNSASPIITTTPLRNDSFESQSSKASNEVLSIIPSTTTSTTTTVPSYSASISSNNNSTLASSGSPLVNGDLPTFFVPSSMIGEQRSKQQSPRQFATYPGKSIQPTLSDISLPASTAVIVTNVSTIATPNAGGRSSPRTLDSNAAHRLSETIKEARAALRKIGNDSPMINSNRNSDEVDQLQLIAELFPPEVKDRYDKQHSVAVERRQSEILESLRAQQKRAENEAEKQVPIQEQLWAEREKKARDAEQQIQIIARKARQTHHAHSLQMRHSNSLLPALEELLNNKTNSLRIQRSQKPLNRDAIMQWFISEEKPRGAGLDQLTQKVAVWFHGIISRQDADSLLLNCPVGSFLVRVSERIWGYALSYKTVNKVKHFLVERLHAGYQFLGLNQILHETLYDLVDYHKDNPITAKDNELLMFPVGQVRYPPDYNELFSVSAV